MALGDALAGKLTVLLDVSTAKLKSGLAAADAQMGAFSKKTAVHGGAAGNSFSKAFKAGIAGVAVAASAAIAVVAKLGTQFQETEFIIRKATGATGKNLDALTDSMKRVYSVVEADSADVAQAIGDLNTRTNLTGEALERLAKAEIDLADISGQELSAQIATTTRMFGDWSIATDKQVAALDWLWKVSQNTGIGVNELAQSVTYVGAPLRALGFDFETATALMGKWEKEGVNAQTVLSSLRIGLVRLSKEGGGSAEEALAKVMKIIKEAPTDLEAISAATATFGSRAAADFALAVREGRFEVEDLLKVLRESPETIAAADEATESLADKWTELKHKLEVKLAPVATEFLEGITDAFDDITDALETSLDTGDWTGVGIVVTEKVGAIISTIAPFISELALDVVPKVFEGIFEGAAKAWWENFKSPLEEAKAKRLRDPFSLGYLSRDELDEVISGMDMLTGKYYSVIEAQLDLEEATQKLDWEQLSEDISKTTSSMGDMDSASAYAAESVNALSAAYEKTSSIDAFADAHDEANFSLEKYIKNLQAEYDAVVNFQQNMDTLMQRLGESGALTRFAEKGWDIEAVQNILIEQAAENAPALVAALVGADPEVAEEAIQKLMNLIWQESEEQKANFIEQNRALGEAARAGYDEGLTKDLSASGYDVILAHVREAQANRKSGEEAGKAVKTGFDSEASAIPGIVTGHLNKVNARPSGENIGQQLISGIQSKFSMWKPSTVTIPVQFAWGAPAGGMDLQGLISGRAIGGMARSTSDVWRTVKTLFPSAVFMGGYARSGHVRGSDHYTGHAFDVGGTPGQMKAIAATLAAHFDAWGIKQIIHDSKQFRGSGWYPYRGPNPHTGHVHVSTYDVGGLLPPGTTLATNYTGGYEVVLPAGWIDSLTEQIGQLVQAIRDQINADAEIAKGTKGQHAMLQMMDLFSERADVTDSFVTRERARLSMQQAQGLGADVQSATVSRQIEFLNMAIAEAQIALDTAKAQHGSTPEQINELATRLFELQADAAQARSELEALARLPFEQAVSRWNAALSQTQTLMNLVSSSSNAFALQLQLLPTLMGQMGASYQNSLELMNLASTPEQIMGYATDAIGSLTDMFNAEQSLINQQLNKTLGGIDEQQSEWQTAWQARSRAVQEAGQDQVEALQESSRAQINALQDSLTALQKSQRAELDALNKYYDDRLRLLDNREKEITRAQQRNQAARAVGSLEEELRILRGQGYYTEADIKRMRELEAQIQEQRDSMQQQEEAWAREDERAALEREKEQQIALLQQQQAAEIERLQAQIKAAQEQAEAQQKALQQQLEMQQRALQDQYEQQMAAYERQRQAARAAAQAEIDNLVLKYQTMIQEVIDQQNRLLAEQMDYKNAGYALGQSFAEGLIAALPLIQEAAEQAALAAADYLELHSPAKYGPLSDLDRWWDKFVPTIAQGIRPGALGELAVRSLTQAPAQNTIRTSEEVLLIIEFRGTVQEGHNREIAEMVEEQLTRKLQRQRMKYGGTRWPT